MKINDDNYELFHKLEEKGFEVKIYWTDAENLEGFITIDSLFELVQDLSAELDRTEEELDDTNKELKIAESQIPNEPDPYDTWRDKWI